MNIFKELFADFGKKRVVAGSDKFNKLSEDKKQAIINKAANLKGEELNKTIQKQPYLLPYIIGDLNADSNSTKLIDIATKAGVSVYDLIDKNGEISNAIIVNTAVRNQPELVLELDDMTSLQDLITSESFIEAFVQNPEVIFSDCKVLNSKIIIRTVNGNNKAFTRTSTLRAQLKRAINLYFRPNSYKGTIYDEFAKSVADRITADNFLSKISSTKMTTRMATAANEVLKRSPEKGKVMPAKALKNWNNRVLYVVPGLAKAGLKQKESQYQTYYSYLLGLLKNTSLSSFSQKQRTKLAKRCVSIYPEIYFELSGIPAFRNAAQELTVQLSVYEAFKEKNDTNGKIKLMLGIDENRKKKLLTKHKANETRRVNKLKKADKEEEKTL